VISGAAVTLRENQVLLAFGAHNHGLRNGQLQRRCSLAGFLVFGQALFFLMLETKHEIEIKAAAGFCKSHRCFR
jgi:hypothetical protein